MDSFYVQVDVNFLVSLSPDLETSQKLVENEKKCIEELIRERDTLSKVRICSAPVFSSGVTTANHQSPSSQVFLFTLFSDPTNLVSSFTTSISLLFALCPGVLSATSNLSILLVRCSLSRLTHVATWMPQTSTFSLELPPAVPNILYTFHFYTYHLTEMFCSQ